MGHRGSKRPPSAAALSELQSDHCRTRSLCCIARVIRRGRGNSRPKLLDRRDVGPQAERQRAISPRCGFCRLHQFRASRLPRPAKSPLRGRHTLEAGVSRIQGTPTMAAPDAATPSPASVSRCGRARRSGPSSSTSGCVRACRPQPACRVRWRAASPPFGERSAGQYPGPRGQRFGGSPGTFASHSTA